MLSAIEKLRSYYDSVALTFQSRVPGVREALDLIRSTGGSFELQLLALRRYIRIEMNGKSLAAQWVWDRNAIAAFKSSPQWTQHISPLIDRVVKQFETANPGYKLTYSDIRDLRRQVSKWNHNDTVMVAAHKLNRTCLSELERTSGTDPVWPDAPKADDIQRFRKFLGDCPVYPEPSNAAPGTSDHGQMHAVDFVVVQGGNTIADTVTATIPANWERAGWTEKLKRAVTDSKSGLIGPLHQGSLYEPWHYAFPH